MAVPVEVNPAVEQEVLVLVHGSAAVGLLLEMHTK